ncbi:MAG: S-layer homology domain-containing protein, partial [Clostridiales bacterium]|nr:S-layer homology domain-containing protein [Clostridiales bacterium]
QSAEAAVHLPYTLYAADELAAAFGTIKTATDGAAVKDAIEEYGGAVGLDLSVYGALTETAREYAVAAFLSNRGGAAGEADVPEVSALLTEASIAARLKYAEAAEMTALLGAYEPLLQLKETEVYQRFRTSLEPSDASDALNRRFAEYNTDGITDYASIRTAYEHAVLVYMVYKNESWYRVREVVEHYGAGLGMDLSKLNGIPDVTEMYKAMNGMPVNTVDDLISVYDAAARDAGAEKKPPSKASGGGGSGGTVSIIPPPTANPDIDETPADAPVFSDMEGAAWAVGAVEYLYRAGIVSGKGENLFYPSDLVTREEFAKLLALAKGLPLGGADGAGFADVDADTWYAPYIAAAKSAGIVNGISAERFGVGETITREDMAVMLYRAVKPPAAIAEAADFTDSTDISAYAIQAVRNLSAAGIVNGMEDGRFAPSAGATRAEAARMIYNALTSGITEG